MKILITGSNGFIGRALTARILQSKGLGDEGAPLERLILCDARSDDSISDPRVRAVIGDLSDPSIVSEALRDPPDIVFHLAAVPGGAAEANYELGRQVNIDAPMQLIERLRKQLNQPRLVMSSSIAVFGSPLPSRVDDDTLPSPAMSYGAQKLMMEIYLNDLARRGEIDARCIRLPGIVARPRQAGGHISAYMSNVFYAIAAGEAFICPVSKAATAWFMSVTCVIDNLIHAAKMSAPGLGARRVWTLPALTTTMGEMVEEIGKLTDRDAGKLVSYEPDEKIESQFGRYPPLETKLAQALGFRSDGTIEVLVKRALDHAGL